MAGRGVAVGGVGDVTRARPGAAIHRVRGRGMVRQPASTTGAAGAAVALALVAAGAAAARGAQGRKGVAQAGPSLLNSKY